MESIACRTADYSLEAMQLLVFRHVLNSFLVNHSGHFENP
jgi:hypothetical protein